MRLVTLGDIVLTLDGHVYDGPASRKHGVALLAYLALEGAVQRDRLATVLWPRVGLDNARHSLSQTFYLIRKELGEEIFKAVSERAALNPEAATVDARELEEAAAAEDWATVTELYRGPFLDGFYVENSPDFDQWQARTQTRLATLARRGFAHALEEHSSAGELDLALTLALRWSDMDPLEDDAQHTLIALLASSGNRAAALQRFEAYRDRLAAELEVEPLERTLELVQRIRAGEITAAESGVGLSDAAPSAHEVAEAEPDRSLVEAPASLRERLEREFSDRLEIQKTLGEGSVATVFLAREPELERLVAVKVFSPRLISDRRARARFEREARSIAALRHRNIVTLYWVDTLSNGLPFIVMQYVKGRTLADRLRAVGRLTADESRLVIMSLAAALQAAHKKGIIHRDVHPGNLLCDEETGRYLLSDFGFATIMNRVTGERPSRITESGELIGQPGYRSPEQLMEKEVGELSDIYGLGLIAYEVLAGRPPYDVGTGKGILRARLGALPALSELRDDIDERWDQLVDRCMAVDPAHRPTAADVLAEARRLGKPDGGIDGGAHEDGLFTRLAKRRVPHFALVYVAGGFGVLELLNQLVERGLASELVYNLGLASYITWFPGVLVAAWFHGRRGPQLVGRVEGWLYGGVALVWLSVCAIILLARLTA